MGPILLQITLGDLYDEIRLSNILYKMPFIGYVRFNYIDIL